MAAPAVRIGLVVPSLENGGGVPAVADFVCRAAERTGRFQVKLVSLATDARDDLSLRLTQPGTWLKGARAAPGGTWRGRPYVRVGAVACELEFQRYRRRSALAAVLQDCDLIQVVCGSPAWANAVLGLGKPVALQVATRAVVERVLRDAAATSPLDRWRRAMTSITNRLDDRALGKVDAIQVENPWMLDYATAANAGRSTVDIRYAPPGVDASLFRPCAADEAAASAPYVLCVGRLTDPRKNIGMLLEAFARVAAALPGPVDLVLAGSGGPNQAFWARVSALGLDDRVRFVASPTLDELVRLYQRCAVFALSSDEEGLGVVLLEAMACGIPVVATRCGGPDGIITHGVDGFLVGRSNIDEMARSVLALLTDEPMRKVMGREARQTIEARYAEELAGAAFIDVWDRLMHRFTGGQQDVPSDRLFGI